MDKKTGKDDWVFEYAKLKRRVMFLTILLGILIAICICMVVLNPEAEAKPLHNGYYPFSVETSVRDK